MSAAKILAKYVAQLNFDRLRLGPPRRFIFFCGGKIDLESPRSPSLRDYLSRHLKGPHAIDDAHFVYAESATQLYRDTSYNDLIAFEADIAQISDIVLIIGESAGSLTELGAFSMNDAIAPRIKIFIQDKYYSEESFIKNGPIRHMEGLREDSVSSYPWRLNSKDQKVIAASAAPHLSSIQQELLERLSQVSAKEKFQKDNTRHQMIAAFWIVQRLRGAILKDIEDSMPAFGLSVQQRKIKNFLYCMRVAEWIDEKKYGHLVYYYPLVDRDPFEYAFNSHSSNDALRLKGDIATEIRQNDLTPPKPILDLVDAKK